MVSQEISELVDRTPLVDTHEHLFEESNRISALTPGDHVAGLTFAAPDFGMLFSHYADADLQSAGMSHEDIRTLLAYDNDPLDKWKLVEPFYRRAYHTGYMQAVRASIRTLCGEEEIAAHNVQRISEQLQKAVQPGYYRRILREVANVEHTQVNSLETPVFMETEQPDLLCQDLNFRQLSTEPEIAAISELAGHEVSSLSNWYEVIDWCFEKYGPRAIALKNAGAYVRRLDYAEGISTAEAAPLFARYRKDPQALDRGQSKALQNHLFQYCLDKAREYNLPVKLHAGYYAGTGQMPLNRVRHNAGDLSDLLMANPHVKFVVMHIVYPYQDEAIALAKHFPNAYVDMCWAWIINPLASLRFLKEFLMAAPVSKLFTFGGDYYPVELVPGHAQIARRGLAQAISELVDEGWIDPNQVEELVERLMRGNAHEVFDYEGTLGAWS